MGEKISTDTYNITLDFVNQIKRLNRDVSIYLVGSYAVGNQSESSDIDILIFADNKDIKYVYDEARRILHRDFSCIMQKIDCTIISRQEYHNVQGCEYQTLYYNLMYNIHLFGPEIRLKFIRKRLKDSLLELDYQLESIKVNIYNKVNYDQCCFVLFAIIRRMKYIDILIHPENLNTKKIEGFSGKEYTQLSKIYERYTLKGISIGFKKTTTFKKQKSGNFDFLSSMLVKVIKVKSMVEKSFDTWCDEE